MKIILISGSCANTLTDEICKHLSNTFLIKIHYTPENKDDIFLEEEKCFDKINQLPDKYDFVIIESNLLLKKIKQDLSIIIENEKNSSLISSLEDYDRIISGELVDTKKQKYLAESLGIDVSIIREICWLSGARIEKVTAIILAGGASRRMGEHKALLEVQGKSMLQNTYDALVPWFDDIIISTSSQVPCPIPNIPRVEDLHPGQGPLMGIYSCVLFSSNHVNFVIACDIPKIDLILIRKLLVESVNYDIVIPSFKKGTCEPLYAVYSKNILHEAESVLNQNKRKISELFSRCSTKCLEIENKGWYVNLNTKEDYQQYIFQIPMN